MPANHSEPLKSQADIPEDEIELIDLLRVIWKWKYLIIGGTFVCVLAAVIFSLNMKKIYSIDTIIEPGLMRIITEGEDQGKRVYFDTPQNIKAMIDIGSFDNKILEFMNKVSEKNDSTKTIKFKTSIPKYSNALKISYETADTEKGKKILKHLNDLLLKNSSQYTQLYQKEFDNEINEKESTLSEISTHILEVKNDISIAQSENDTAVNQKTNKIATIRAVVEAKKIQIGNSQKRIKDVQLEIDSITKNTDFLIEERNKLLASEKKETNILSSMIYLNTIQQTIVHSNNLKNQIIDINNRMVEDQAGIEILENEVRDIDAQKENLINQTNHQIATLKLQIDDLETQKKIINKELQFLDQMKNNVPNLQILQPPVSSPDPIKPKKKLIVILATSIGIFMMVFLSFFIEYITKNRKQKSLEL
jgi:LPS O-antigen subunit length determinant protein (WzzB/FepE family)